MADCWVLCLTHRGQTTLNRHLLNRLQDQSIKTLDHDFCALGPRDCALATKAIKSREKRQVAGEGEMQTLTTRQPPPPPLPQRRFWACAFDRAAAGIKESPMEADFSKMGFFSDFRPRCLFSVRKGRKLLKRDPARPPKRFPGPFGTHRSGNNSARARRCLYICVSRRLESNRP